jgi:hypothetical protein
LQLRQGQSFQPIEFNRSFANENCQQVVRNMEQVPSIKQLRADLNPLLTSHCAYLGFFGNSALVSTSAQGIDYATPTWAHSLSLNRAIEGKASDSTELRARSECHVEEGDVREKLSNPGVQTNQPFTIANCDLGCRRRKQGDQIDDDEFFDAVLDLCKMD